MWYLLIALGILASAIMAIVSRRLLVSAIWLALTSALVAIMLYLLGAPHIAVIELSVGAGLVTVLFVFAINIAGEEVIDIKSILPKPLVWGSVILAGALGIFLIIRAVGFPEFALARTLAPSQILWEERYLDILLQVVLIFAGVLGVIGVLSHARVDAKLEDKS
ncbi:MAG: NADH-quinone oxidoreductase subunit J [Chloroflexi bacterium]|nr:NADH-quinone oxidoreductase subunit J [Chloroflexota bacterium]